MFAKIEEVLIFSTLVYASVFANQCGPELHKTAVFDERHLNSAVEEKDKPINCTYTITTDDPKSIVSIRFLTFDVIANCTLGSVRLYDGFVSQRTLLAKRCGTNPPQGVKSIGNTLIVQYEALNEPQSGGFTSKFRQVDAPRKADCGSTDPMTANTISTSLDSAEQTTRVSDLIDCTYTIIAKDPNNIVSLKFSKFMLVQSENCVDGYLDIYDDKMTESKLLVSSCGIRSPDEVNSTGSTMILHYKAQSQPQAGGFRTQFRQVPVSKPDNCGDISEKKANHTDTIFTSQGYGTIIPSVIDCVYKIKAIDNSKKVMINFTEFNILSSTNCTDGSVKIYDGAVEEAKLLSTKCAKDSPSKVVTTGSTMIVHYKALRQPDKGGFKSVFKQVSYSTRITDSGHIAYILILLVISLT